jgi:hypothetical protein
VTDEHVVKAGETEIARKRRRKRGVDLVRKSWQSSTVHLFFFESNDIVATGQPAGSFTWTPSVHEKNKYRVLMIVIADGALLDAFLNGPELWSAEERRVLDAVFS